MEIEYMFDDSKSDKGQSSKQIGQNMGRMDQIHLDFLLSAMPGAVLVFKIHEGHAEIITCSCGISKLIGWDAAELCTRYSDPSFHILYPADEALFHSMIMEIVKTESPRELMYRAYKKDGTIIWLWFQGHYVGEEDGDGIIEALILDASDNADMYQTVLDQAQSLVTIVDAASFEVLYANRVAQDTVTQLCAGEYLGAVCHQHIMDFDKPCPFCIVNHTKEDSWVNPQIELSGRIYRQVFKRMKWHDRDAILEFTTDITEQVENMNTINRQRNMNATILDAIPAGIMVFKLVDDKIEIISANKAICNMAGMDGVKAVGKGDKEIFALTYPDDRQIVADAAMKLRKPNSYVEYEYRQYYPSRERFVWVLGQGHSEINPDDGCVYAYISYTDITARKEVGELQEKLKLAEMEASTKMEFYSQMSHDMRTPMNGILGLARLAVEENNIERLHQDMEQILQSGQYMLSLINDTLDLQRLETGNMILEPKVVQSKELFADIFSMVNPAIAEKQLHFDFQVSDETNNEWSWYIRIDPVRFKQIIVNLLSNSIKFTSPGGNITLRIEDLGQEGNIAKSVISIEDTGIGMSKEFVSQKLYQPFSQESKGMNGKYGGSGLGLSIVKKLVDLMGGRIEVSSEQDKGTTFFIYLNLEVVPPEEARHLQEKKHTIEEDHKHFVKGKRILLCEDHPLNAEIAKRLLTAHNCEVECAKNGQIGVSMFAGSPPGHYDAILMDIRMPEMDGLEATRAIRLCEHPDAQTIPIIAMSANAYEEDVRKSIEAGMNEHLAKPVSPEILFKILAKYLAGSED